MDISKIYQITKILERTADKLGTYQILDVNSRYSRALMLLDDYDYERIQKPEGEPDVYKLNYSECRKIIDDMSMNKNSRIFGIEKDESFKTSIENTSNTKEKLEMLEWAESLYWQKYDLQRINNRLRLI